MRMERGAISNLLSIGYREGIEARALRPNL